MWSCPEATEVGAPGTFPCQPRAVRLPSLTPRKKYRVHQIKQNGKDNHPIADFQTYNKYFCFSKVWWLLIFVTAGLSRRNKVLQGFITWSLWLRFYQTGYPCPKFYWFNWDIPLDKIWNSSWELNCLLISWKIGLFEARNGFQNIPFFMKLAGTVCTSVIFLLWQPTLGPPTMHMNFKFFMKFTAWRHFWHRFPELWQLCTPRMHHVKDYFLHKRTVQRQTWVCPLILMKDKFISVSFGPVHTVCKIPRTQMVEPAIMVVPFGSVHKFRHRICIQILCIWVLCENGLPRLGEKWRSSFVHSQRDFKKGDICFSECSWLEISKIDFQGCWDLSWNCHVKRQKTKPVAIDLKIIFRAKAINKQLWSITALD